MITERLSARRRAAGQAPPAADDESRAWLAALRSRGAEHDDAVARLHDLLLRAARFEGERRRGSLPHLARAELDDLVQQAADDALVALLGKLDSFRGDSRFTTWAYKFALLEAGVKLRRRAWHGHEIPLEDEGPLALPDVRQSPAADVESNELLSAIARAIETQLTPHQRHVLVSITVHGVPIDVLAERLSTTRGRSTRRCTTPAASCAPTSRSWA